MGFDAFMSYSHAADGRLAPQVQAGLQRFAKPWWRRRALRVFRDETGLAASPQLWAGIEEALASSEWFVFLASPEAARSEWVERELEWWLVHRSAARILPVVTDGELVWDRATGGVDPGASTAVPPLLAGVWTDEPRWVDLRWARDAGDLDLRDARFRDAIADIAAPLHGIAKDELESEEVRQHRRTVRTAVGAAAGLAVLAVLAVVAGLFAAGQRDDAREQARISSARAVAAQAEASAPVQADRALLLGARGVLLHEDVETRRGLLAALESAGSLVGYRRELGVFEHLTVAPDGSSVVTVVDDVLRRWDTGTWELAAEAPAEGLDDVWGLAMPDRGDHVVVRGPNGLRLFHTEDLAPASPVLDQVDTTAAGSVSAVSPEGTRFVVVADATVVSVGDTATGDEVDTLDVADPSFPECSGVDVVVPGPDATLLLQCPEAVYVADLDDPDADPVPLDVVPFLVAGGGFSPDGSLLVILGFFGEVVLLDATTGDLLGRTVLPAAYALDARFDPAGRLLALAGSNGTVTLWTTGSDPSAEDGPPLSFVGSVAGFDDDFLGVGFLPADAGTRLLVGSPAGGAVVWDPSQRTVIGDPVRDGVLSPRADARNGIVYVVPDSEYLPQPGEFSGDLADPTTIEAVSVEDGRTVRSFDVDAGTPILDFAPSEDGARMLVTAAPVVEVDGTWDQDMGVLRFLVVSTEDGAVERDIAPDGLPNGARWFRFTWSPDERWAAYLIEQEDPEEGYVGRLVVVDLASGESKLVDVGAFAYAIGWSSAGEIVVGDYYGLGVTFVDPTTGETTPWQLPSEASSFFGVLDIETAPDGALVLTSDAGEVWLVDPVSREPLGDPFRRGGTQLKQAAVSPDGGTVAALDRNGAIVLWDRATGVPVSASLRAHATGFDWDDVAFLDDGTLVSAAAPNPDVYSTPLAFRYEILRWRLDAESLAATACGLAGRELTAEEWRTFVDPDGSPELVCG